LTRSERGRELGAWIAWARQHADRLDPLVADADIDDVIGPVGDGSQRSCWTTLFGQSDTNAVKSSPR